MKFYLQKHKKQVIGKTCRDFWFLKIFVYENNVDLFSNETEDASNTTHLSTQESLEEENARQQQQRKTIKNDFLKNA